MNFTQLVISEDIVKILKNNGITEPAPVQAESISFIKNERAGEEGYTCLFIDSKDSLRLKEIEKAIKFKIPRRDLGEENHGYK